MHNRILYTLFHYNGNQRAFKGKTVFFMSVRVPFFKLTGRRGARRAGGLFSEEDAEEALAQKLPAGGDHLRFELGLDAVLLFLRGGKRKGDAPARPG